MPRLTGDIDFLVRPEVENSRRILKALGEFGFASLGLKEEDFTTPGQFVQFGSAPYRIDVSTGITGVEFDEVWASKITGDIQGLPVQFIGLDAYLKNKEATGRDQDLWDVAKLKMLMQKNPTI